MKFPCVISKGIFHIKQKGNFHLYYNSLKRNLLQNSVLNKNAFQDAYRPLVTVRAVSVQGGSLSGGWVFVQAGLCPGGVSVRETPPVNKMADRQAGVKTLPSRNFVCRG